MSLIKSTAKKYSTPNSQRIRCKLFQSITNNAVWLKKQSTNDLHLVESVLEDFQQHLNSGCFCTSRSATYLAMGTTHLEQFFIMFTNSMAFLCEKEDQMKKLYDDYDNQNKRNNPINDLDLKEESSFGAHYNENINQSNFRKLTKNLFNSLQMFEKALDVDKKEKILTSIFFERLGILTSLNTLFQIFLYYGMNIYAFKTIDLALIAIKTYYAQNNENEEIIIIRCNLIKVLLKLGFIEIARSYYKRFFTQFKFDDINMIDSFANSYVFLLYCELLLRSRNGKLVASKLKDFIESEYLQKSTIKRYILKAMAYALAVRFPSAVYHFGIYFNEFIDPIQMSVGICRRWKMFKMFFANNNNDVTNPDPWWIRFITFNIFSDSFEHFIDFHINNGLTTDPIFYYKIATNLYTVTLNLLNLAKLQLIGASYDISNGFLIDAKFKLILFKKFFHKSSFNENMFIYQLDHKNENVSKDDSLILQTKYLAINDEINNCDSNKDYNSTDALFYCYKRLVIEARSGTFSSQHDCDDENIPVEDLLKTFLKDFQSLKLSKDIVLNIFYQYLFYIINTVMINYEESKNGKLISKEQYLFLLNLFEQFTIQIYCPTYKTLLKSSSISSMKNEFKTTIEEQIVNGPIAALFWILSYHFIRIEIFNGFYEEAMPFLTKLIEISTYSYRDRIYRSQILYYRALALYKLLKTNTFNGKKIYVIKTHHLNENILDLNQNSMLTPSPKKNNNNNILNTLKAPTKASYLSETVKQYGHSLLEKISRKSGGLVEGTRKNALNFDDEELESLDKTNGDKIKSTEIQNNQDKKYIKSRKTSINSQIFNSAFDIYVDSDVEDDCGYEYISSLTQMFSNLTVENDDNRKTNDVYLHNLFNVEEFNKNFDVRLLSIDDIKQCLKKIIYYIGCHPSHKLYVQVQYLNYKLAKLSSKSTQILSYHLAETASYHAFRIRLLFSSFKKINNLKSVQYDVDFMSFKHEYFHFQPYINDLPKTWRFVQIKFIENGSKFQDLLLCRFQSGYKPFFVKIKNDRQKVTKFFLDEFEEIMKMNSVSIFETEKDAFWKLRYEYDNRLKYLLHSTERNIFGFAKGIFMGQLNDKKYLTACSWFKRKVLEFAKQMNLECKDQQLLDIVIESIVILKPDETEAAAKILFETDNLKFISKFDGYRRSYFSTWLNNEKSLEQLFDGIQPVGLIIDPILNQFPLESMPSFRRLNQPFFRVPSLRVANLLYKKYKAIMENGINDEKTFYLLNPENNLENTEKFFKNSFLAIQEWNGFIGKAPDGETLEQNLETKDIYIYMGHGSGSQYYRMIPNGLDIVNINSLSIVVGCSSGRVTCENKNADIFGAAYRFLTNGAPTYIGTLWDITDKDIDKFFNNFMSCWFKRWTSVDGETKKMNSLCKSIAYSRDSCKLKHLIGCAPVVYGLPINYCLK